MTGKWVPEANLEARRRHVRLQLVFTKITLCFLDVRKFGYALMMSYGDWRKSLSERRVGLDVFDPALTPRLFHGSVCRGRGSIKSALLNQQRVCGVGNIYACEALYDAKIDPRAAAGELIPLQAERLLDALRAVMTHSLERETGDEIYYLTDGNPQNPFHVYGRGGDSCGRCGGTIAKMTQSARTTFFCQAARRCSVRASQSALRRPSRASSRCLISKRLFQ